ncbi:MAG TPA: CheR family methyltransferase, partial [Alphaproteobacteria bacterium]|nr:CheR family methyltransferase [Alphaproteobacteria bacterium]
MRRPRAAVVVPVEGAGGAQYKLPFLVVGIGASAGGLEAFEKFFTQTPADSGMAFVLVPHLDAAHKSSMVELVQRFTAMKVVEIVGDTRPEPNRVYVIPPNPTLTMRRGRLRLTTPRDEPGTVDPFFRSLAEDQGDHAIAVVLSGSGSDGAVGIRAVKEHGGLTVAQAAESSRFGSMPHSAVATGLVDLVLAVEEMPKRLIEYAGHLVHHRDKSGEAFGDHRRGNLVRIYTLLRRRTGHDFSRYKDSTFIRRVQRRMQVVRITSPAAYIELLRNEPREVDLLFRDLLIGVTKFFRDPQAFTALVSEVIPKLVEGKSADDQIRVWVPGCSTGEEAYSLAIVIREALAKCEVVPKVSIFATDIDGEALEVARAGRYPATIAADLTPERLERFFLREGDHYRVVKDIREMCLFSQHNIISDAPFSRLDLISCRNLLIYLDASLQNRIIPLFHFALRNGGYLFLGPSENVTQHGRLFTRLDGKHRLFKAKLVPAQVFDLPLGAGIPRGYGPLHRSAPVASGEEAVSRRAARLMESYAPAYVVLD